jgi:exopolysaccharide production protein ExoY
MIIKSIAYAIKLKAHDYHHAGLPQFIQQLIACLAILVLSPILLLTALAIRINSKGPLIYSQVRVGEQGKRFTMYKFRSMYMPDDSRYQMPARSDRDGICKKSFNDPRITAVGRIIRKLSIDELPQLFNVLTGDMALVGPRPALPSEVDAYAGYMLHRFDAKPGLTGLWQVSGRADIGFDDQILLDFKYVEERNIITDLKILFATIPAVLTGRGAY